MKSGLIASKSFLGMALLGLVLSLGCAGHETAEKLPTLRTFEGHYDVIWGAARSVVEEQNRAKLKVASMKEGFMASDWVAEERTLHDPVRNLYSRVPSRYRVNITFRRLPVATKPKSVERVTVTVSKQLELQDGKKWRAFPSDYQTEAAIIAAIGRELGQ